MLHSTLAFFLVLALPAMAAAQHGHSASPPPAPPREVSQFEFLVGQWEIVAQPHVSGLAAKIHGAPKFPGTWKAWRGLDGFGIEDEVRLTDASGNPRALTHTLRVYDTAAKRWSISVLDVYRATFTSASAEWRDGRMHVETRGTDQEGRAYISRARFYDITPDSFRMQQDRSYDAGRTWTDGFLKVDAKRLAAVAPR